VGSSKRNQGRSTIPSVPRAGGKKAARPRPDVRRVSQASPLMDAKTAAKMLGVPYTWLLAQARADAVPHHRLGHYVRFDEEELVEWVRENERGPRRQ